MKYFSTFSGIGGFEVGIHNAVDNATCVGYSEIDRHAIKTYEEHYDHRNFGDITNIDPAQLPDFELLVGGFPCQPFSVAGRRRGFEEARGTFFFDIARILEHKRPRHLVLENVKGLLNHDTGKTFQTILRILAELGYDVEWQLFNSKGWGVPQRRERVYIVGHLRRECKRKILPVGVESPGDSGTGKPYKPRAQSFIKTRHLSQNRTLISEAITLQATEIPHLVEPSHKHGETRIYDKGIAPTVQARYGTGGDNVPYLIQHPSQKINRTVRSGGGMSYTNKHKWDSHLIDGRIRRLTPVECERLQGFTDGWTIGTDAQRYKQCGNAVTTNVVTAVMEALSNGCRKQNQTVG